MEKEVIKGKFKILFANNMGFNMVNDANEFTYVG